MQRIEVSPVFSRYWIEGVLQKSETTARRKLEKLWRHTGKTRGSARSVGYISGHQLLQDDELEFECPASKPESVSVTIGIHKKGSEGEFEVADSHGDVVFATSTSEITQVKPPHRETQHFMSLPLISRDMWPIAIRTKGANSELLVLQTMAEYVEP
jgi:hypothetical protein